MGLATLAKTSSNEDVIEAIERDGGVIVRDFVSQQMLAAIRDVPMTMTLDIGWLRQEENHYLSLSREVVKNYPEEVQRLLGWGVCPPFLGWVEFDGLMTDPSVLLGDSAPVGADLTGGYGKK